MHISGAIKNGSKIRILREDAVNHPVMKTQVTQPPVDKVTAETKQRDTADPKRCQKKTLKRTHKVGVHKNRERNKGHRKCAQGKPGA